MIIYKLIKSKKSKSLFVYIHLNERKEATQKNVKFNK